MSVSRSLSRNGRLDGKLGSRIRLPRSIARPIFWLRCVYAAALLVILASLASDLYKGGDKWKQADWLINNERILVRRGCIGSIVIGVADLIGTAPLLIVVLVQGFLVTITTILTLKAAERIGVTWKFFLILSSEGFFLLNWAGNFDGAARKELFLYFAFALLAHGATFPKLPTVHLGLFVLALILGSAGNEGLIFALPAGLCLLGFTWDWDLTRARLGLGAGVIVVVVVVALVNALSPPLATTEPVCTPLLSRGLRPEFCTGAIEALTHSLSDEMGQVRHDLWYNRLPGIVFAYTLGGLPFLLYVHDGCRTNRRQALLFWLIGASLFPLFIVAKDWGRWITIHLTSAAYLFLVLRARGRATEGLRPWPSFILTSVALLSVTVGYSYVAPLPELGLAKELTQLCMKLVRQSIQ